MSSIRALNFVCNSVAVLSCLIFLKSDLVCLEGPNAAAPNSYKVVVETLLPLAIVDDGRFWDELEWAFSVRILPRRDLTPEVQFTLYKSYDKRIAIDYSVPKNGTIRQQLKDLKRQNPNEKFEEIIRKISIEKGSLSQDDLPALIGLASEVEGIRIRSILPNSLYLDPDLYEFWSGARARSLQLNLITPPGSVKRTHPLIEWTDKVRTSLQSHLHQKD